MSDDVLKDGTKSANDEINLIDVFRVLLKRRKIIIYGTLAVAVVSVIASLLMSNIYEGKVNLMPAQQGSGTAAGLLSQVAGSFGLAGFLGGNSPSSDFVAGVLQGNTIADAIIDRFNLMELYGQDTRVETRKMLSGFLVTDVDKKSGIVSVKVYDEEPQRAADMANAYVEELSKLLGKVAITSASQRRLFFEQKVKEAREDLVHAEEAVKSFQESTGAIKLDDQARAVLEGIAALRAQVVGKEIELKVMKTYAAPGNWDLRRLEEELKGLKGELQKLEEKGSHVTRTDIPTSDMPALGTEYLRKIREFKYQEALYEFMSKQFESARLDEANDQPAIQILDRATTPDRKAKPKRSLIVIGATFGGFILFVFLALFVERIDSIDESSRFGMLLGDIKAYFPEERYVRVYRVLRWVNRL